MSYHLGMEEKKTSALAMLEILKEYSDEKHPLSREEIITHLSSSYGINLDRRTIYKNIGMLQDYGYDISTYRDNNVGYFLRDRQFEKSEVFLLCNVIHASNMIPSAASKQLIRKLLSTQSRYVTDEFHDAVYIENNAKKENKEFFYNIEILSDAIAEHKAIVFNYLTYDINKKLVNKREKLYEVSPYSLVYANERTYLIAKTRNHEGMTHYRVDKMKNISVDNSAYEKPLKKTDPYEYARNKLYMFHGDESMIALKCDYAILDDIIDYFGKEVTVYGLDEEHFMANIKAPKQGMIYYASQYLEHLEIVEPLELREELKEYLKKGLRKYR